MIDTANMLDLPVRFDPSGGDVLSFALSERNAGRPAAIVSLIGIEGSSPRSPGAQMAVAQDGRYVGTISSGCLERAIVAEAREAMARGYGGVVRYGKGSPFLDVVLPCGSGIDLLISINPPTDALQSVIAAQRARRAAALEFYPEGGETAELEQDRRGHGGFVRTYLPALKIIAAGIGADLFLLSRIARAAGHVVCAVSPDDMTLQRCAANETIKLQSPSSIPPLAIDRWTAVVLLFHDREWELALAPAALNSPAFYIGAVGSPKTHAERLDALRQRGVDEQSLNRIKGPIGLIPATRDPSALAISVLAGVLADWPYQRA